MTDTNEALVGLAHIANARHWQQHQGLLAVQDRQLRDNFRSRLVTLRQLDNAQQTNNALEGLARI